MAENEEINQEGNIPYLEEGSELDAALLKLFDEVRENPDYQGLMGIIDGKFLKGKENIGNSLREKVEAVLGTAMDNKNATFRDATINNMLNSMYSERDPEKAKTVFRNRYNNTVNAHNEKRKVEAEQGITQTPENFQETQINEGQTSKPVDMSHKIREEAQSTLADLGGSLGADRLKDLQTKGQDGISPRKKINSFSLQDLARLQVEIQLSKMDGKDDFKGIEGIVNNAVLKKMENVAAGYSMGKDWETFKTNKQSLQALHKFSPELKKNFALTMNIANHRINPPVQRNKLYKGDMKGGFINSVIHNNFYRSGSWGKKNIIQPWRHLKRKVRNLFKTPKSVLRRRLRNHNRRIKAELFVRSIPSRVKSFAKTQKDRTAKWMGRQWDNGVKWFKNTKVGKALSTANKWRKDTAKAVKDGVINGAKAVGRGVKTGANYVYKGAKFVAKVATAPIWGPPYLLYRGTKAAYSWGVKKVGDIKRDIRTSMNNSIARAQEDKMRYANRGKNIYKPERQDEINKKLYEDESVIKKTVVNEEQNTAKTVETQEHDQMSQTPPVQTQEHDQMSQTPSVPTQEAQDQTAEHNPLNDMSAKKWNALTKAYDKMEKDYKTAMASGLSDKAEQIRNNFDNRLAQKGKGNFNLTQEQADAFRESKSGDKGVYPKLSDNTNSTTQSPSHRMEVSKLVAKKLEAVHS